MSVWYSAFGTIRVKNGCRLSIKTLLQEEFSVEGPVVSKTTKGIDEKIIEVKWSNSLEGKCASKEIEKVLERIKCFDRNAFYDLRCEIRFLN